MSATSVPAGQLGGTDGWTDRQKAKSAVGLCSQSYPGQTSAEWTAKVLRTCSRGSSRTCVHYQPPLVSRQLIAAVQVWIPWLEPLCLRTGALREPRALPPTEATGNVGVKAQVAGRQVGGPEADRLLTLEHTGSDNRVLAGDDAVAATNSHPCPVLRLPPAWPLGCGADDVPAFCLVCFHREEEELEEVPLQRSVLGWAVGCRDHLQPSSRNLGAW